MKIYKVFFVLGLIFLPLISGAAELFHDDVKIQDGIDVHATSNVFADIICVCAEHGFTFSGSHISEAWWGINETDVTKACQTVFHFLWKIWRKY